MFTFTKPQLLKLSKTDLIDVILSAQSTTPIAPLSSETEIIQEHEWNGLSATKIIKVNGKKFKLFYEKSNGSPLGFNYKMCASVMNESGSWDYVCERKDIIDYQSDVSYVYNKEEREADSIDFIEKLQLYIEKIYA